MFSKKSFFYKLILPSLMFLFILIIGGCGNKPNNTGNSSAESISPAPSSSTPAEAVTYENYLKIKLDSTYDDVKSILGEGKKKADNNPDVVSYNWGGSDGQTINVQINKGKVEAKTQAMLGKTTSTLTVDQFNKVTKDMTFDQVVSILGPDYQESSYKKSANAIRRVIIWMRPDFANVTVVLQDDKVINTYNFLK